MSEIESTETTSEQNGAPKPKNKEKVKFESTMQRAEAVAYFQAFVDGLRQGSIHIKQGDKTLSLTPASSLELEVKASRKGKDGKIAFELEWEYPTAELEISSS